MKVTTNPAGETKSSWYDGLKFPRRQSLGKSTHADVCVVGAGIAGLTTAYLLAREGKSVIVLEERAIGGGETGRTSAHLASAIDDRFFELEKSIGADGARLAYESHAAAIDMIEVIAKREKIDCDFARLDAFLSVGHGQSETILDDEFEAAKRAGVKDIELLETGGLGGARCLRFGKQARFQPMKYLLGLATAVKELGVKIYVGDRVIDVQGFDAKKKTPAFAQLKNKTKVTADAVVVATNAPSPINDWFAIYLKQHSYRSYMVGALVPRGSVADALYWDTLDPYHYVRVQRLDDDAKNDVLLIGGEDHKVGQLPKHAAPFDALAAWGRTFFPTIGEIRFRWSGEVQEPADGLAFIGTAPTSGENVFVATGDSGMGLTHGTIAGLLITDKIIGRESPWEKVYDPSRGMVNREYLSENANTVAQYKDLLTGGDVSDISEIEKGQGAVIRSGLSKLAVYRDDDGKVHKHSAICTHLQCVVAWNAIEKSWDCPCHGSRFDCNGKVLMGPAIEDLPSVS